MDSRYPLIFKRSQYHIQKRKDRHKQNCQNHQTEQYFFPIKSCTPHQYTTSTFFLIFINTPHTINMKTTNKTTYAETRPKRKLENASS